MFRHLLHKPSEQKVKEIIINAVRIEQVGNVSRLPGEGVFNASVLLSSCVWSPGVPHGGLAGEAHWDELRFNEAVH